MGLRLYFMDKWRCGAVERPEEPVMAIGVPDWIDAPLGTRMCERWQ